MWTRVDITTKRGTFPALETGDGAPLLCLHGFPDSPETFGPLVAPLQRRLGDRRVVAPYLRGYHPATAGSDYFDGATLAADCAALCTALSPETPVDVVGHDWGALAVYGLTSAYPQLARRAIAMAVPPPATFVRVGLDPAQLQRSFYIWFFQLDGLPEAALTLSGDLVDHLWRTWSPGLAAPAHLDTVRLALSDPAIARCAIGYYRAMFRPEWTDPALADVRASIAAGPRNPVLVLAGADDGCVDHAIFPPALDDLPDGSEVAIVREAGHFMHLEQPDAVAARIADWLGHEAQTA